MSFRKLDLEGLALVDNGRVKAGFDLALSRAEKDCHDRPSVTKPRTVTLTVQLKPIVDAAGEYDHVAAVFGIGETFPKRSTHAVSMTVANGGLFWNDLSPDEVRQGTIDQAHLPTVLAENDEGDEDEESEGLSDAN